MSLTLALNAAVTGLSTAQAGLDVISNNIANVNTQGFTRKIFNQESLDLAGQGSGVEISSVSNSVNQNLLNSLRDADSDLGTYSTLDSYLTQIQNTFGTVSSQDSIASEINNLSQDFTTLSTNPSTPTAQLQTIQAAQTVAGGLNNLGNTIQNLRVNADRDISTQVTQINTILQNISKLNDQISLNTATGQSTADLDDKRNLALNQLSSILDIRYYTNANGTVTVFTSDGTTLVDSAPATVSHSPLTQVNPSDTYAAGDFNAITVGVRDITDSIRSGSLKALVNLRDNVLPDMQSQVDQLSQSLEQSVNQVSNRGTAYPQLTNNVTGTTQFMSPSTQTITMSGGNTSVILFDNSGNEVASSQLTDPAGVNFTNGGTLSSLASQLQTWVQAQNPQLANATVSFNSKGQFSVNLGSDSYGIAFQDEASATKGSAQTDTTVGLDLDGDGTVDQNTQGFSNFLGLNDFFTSTPSLTTWTSNFEPSNYSLTTTSPRTLSFSDSANPTGIPGGTVTVNPTESLQSIANAINANSSLQGLITASVVPEASGNRLQISSVVGRQIAVTQVGGTDAIDALGLSPTDSGTSQSLQVNPALVANPANIPRGQVQLDPVKGTYYLAAGDNTTALQLSNLMTGSVSVPAAGSQAAANISLAGYAGSIIANASSVEAANSASLQQQTDLQSSISQQQSSISGVNLDQEMSQLMIYQNSYAASAKVIAATKDMFDILNNLIS